MSSRINKLLSTAHESFNAKYSQEYLNSLSKLERSAETLLKHIKKIKSTPAGQTEAGGVFFQDTEKFRKLLNDLDEKMEEAKEISYDCY